MKMRVKPTILALVLGAGLTLGFVQKDGAAEQINKTAEYKAKSREKLKPYRYDGSKIIFFNYGTYEQKKSLEILMFNGIDYKFCFNTDGVPKGVDIRVYDKDAVYKDRILLYEARGVMSKDVIFTSADLLKTLQEKKSGISSIKKIFVDYIIPTTDKQVTAPAPEKEKSKKGESTSEPQEQGVVVVSYGYRNV